MVHSTPSYSLPLLRGIDPYAQNLCALRGRVWPRAELRELDARDAQLLELPHFNQSNYVFSGDVSPWNVAGVLHEMQQKRDLPTFKKAVELPLHYKKGLAAIRAFFSEFAAAAGVPNKDFAQHVRVVLLKRDDYRTWHRREGGEIAGGNLSMGNSNPVAKLIVQPLISHDHFLSTLVHEFMHCMSHVHSFIQQTSADEVSHCVVRSGLYLLSVMPGGMFRDSFAGLDEWFVDFFAAGARVRLGGLIGRKGNETYELRVRLAQELLSKIRTMLRYDERTAYLRAFNSLVGGGVELYQDIFTALGEQGYRDLAAVGTSFRSVEAFVRKNLYFRHLLPVLEALQRKVQK